MGNEGLTFSFTFKISENTKKHFFDLYLIPDGQVIMYLNVELDGPIGYFSSYSMTIKVQTLRNNGYTSVHTHYIKRIFNSTSDLYF